MAGVVLADDGALCGPTRPEHRGTAGTAGTPGTVGTAGSAQAVGTVGTADRVAAGDR